MSDPQPDKLKPKPRRAEPLQPDLPGRGTSTESASDEQLDQAATEKQHERNETAIENTRKGYG